MVSAKKLAKYLSEFMRCKPREDFRPQRTLSGTAERIGGRDQMGRKKAKIVLKQAFELGMIRGPVSVQGERRNCCLATPGGTPLKCLPGGDKFAGGKKKILSHLECTRSCGERTVSPCCSQANPEKLR